MHRTHLRRGERTSTLGSSRKRRTRVAGTLRPSDGRGWPEAGCGLSCSPNYFVKKLLLKKKQFLLYCVIGASGVTLDFATYSLLLKFTGLHYQAANAIGYTAGTLLSFVLNARYNF